MYVNKKQVYSQITSLGHLSNQKVGRNTVLLFYLQRSDNHNIVQSQ
jgi:hypothetical protein